MKQLLFKFDEALYEIQVKADISTISDYITKIDPAQIIITNYGDWLFSLCNILYLGN